MGSSLVHEFGVEGVKKLRALLRVEGSDVEVACADADLESGTVNQVAARDEVVGGPVDDESKKKEDDAASAGAVSETWSDMMESESSGSVSGVPVVSEEVRKSITFGGFGGAIGVQEVGKEKGLMAQYVRTARATSLRAHLAAFGIKMPKASAYNLALMTHSSATIPAFFRSGKEQLKTFAVMGDSTLVAVLASQALMCGQSLESAQRVRTTRLTDAYLQSVFVKSPFFCDVVFAAGVDPAFSKAGATALEAIVGLVAFYRSAADVVVLAKQLGLVNFE